MTKEAIYARLDELGVPYTRYEHEAAHTMEACYALPFAAPDVTICKNMLLCNTQKTQFYLYVSPAEKRFRTSAVSKLIGTSRLSFAPEESLMERLETASGSLSPFGLWCEGASGVRFVADKGVRQTDKIAFHPCDNTSTVVFSQEDFWGRVAATFPEVLWIDAPDA